MEKRLLNILRCPVTHKGLSLAKGEILERLNEAIKAGNVSNRDGAPVVLPLPEALITDDKRLLYPINKGIPVLLEGESISLAELD